MSGNQNSRGELSGVISSDRVACIDVMAYDMRMNYSRILEYLFHDLPIGIGSLIAYFSLMVSPIVIYNESPWPWNLILGFLTCLGVYKITRDMLQASNS